MKLSFPDQCRAAGLPAPTPEHLFAADYWVVGHRAIQNCRHPHVKRHRCLTCDARRRQWRFDWAFLDPGWLAVEQVGGIWTGGHHSRGKDQMDDMLKMNVAGLLGWTVLQFTPTQMDNGYAVDFIQKVFQEDER